MKNLKNFTITELLVKAELDDSANKELYLDEIRTRNAPESGLKKAYNTVEFIRKSRLERAEKPLSIGFKILLTLIPFFYYRRHTMPEINEELEDLKSRGFNKKLDDIRKFTRIGLILYAIVFGTYFILSKYTNTIDKFNSNDHQSGFILNEMRDSLGITLIKPNWYLKEDGIDKGIWSEFKDYNMPYHKEKVVEQNREIDRFLNPISDKETYLLEITYSFSAARANENPWTCFLIHEIDAGDYNYDSNQVSKDQADSVLLKWGL